MAQPTTIFVTIILLAGLGVGGLIARREMPSCENQDLLHVLTRKVSLDRGFSGVIVTDITTLGGQLFEARSCRALMTEIRGNVDLTTRSWTEITYGAPARDPLYEAVGVARPTTRQP